ncbi:MAG TPA: hypothetical protein DEP72_00135 [Clostridiales bacterium]|nr:MAG: hypothetical protein A2Y18_08325 [Clostridiales bacterium GWD2_32_19]HCC06560.1 hypothetical protein [Clostridiales bacterium]
MGINYIICDDQQSAIDILKNNLNRIINNNNLPGKIALATKDANEVIKYAKDYEVDTYDINVYLLDVDLNANRNGLELAKQIRKMDPLAYIIFITAHLEYGMLVFKYKLRAYEYLIKPVDYADFRKCIMSLNEDYIKLLNSIENNKQSFLNIISGYKEYRINTNDILYIESKGAKAVIHTINNNIETYMSLGTLEVILNGIKMNYFRIHKTFLINIMHIEQVNFSQLYVKIINGDICMISRNKKQEFKKAMNNSNLTISYRE